MTKKHGFEFTILVIVLCLVAIGCVAVYSASFYEQQLKGKSETYYLKKQLMGAGIGAAAMLLCIFLPKKLLNNMVLPSLAVLISIGLLIAVLFQKDYNGAKRWLYIKSFGMQPSEIARFSIVYFTACWLDRYDLRSKDPREFLMAFCGPLLVTGVIVLLVMIGKNLSMTVTILMMLFILYYAAGLRGRLIAILAGGGGILGTILILIEPYRIRRVLSFLDPFAAKLGDGFQVVQGLYAIGAGGLFGVGIGNSKQKLAFLPEIESDFILALIAEEAGLIGVIILLAAYWVLIWRGIVVSFNTVDNFDMLLSLGLVSLIGLQLLINVGVVTSSIPPTGVPLPFISAGNSSLIVFMASAGLLLGVSRRQRKV